MKRFLFLLFVVIVGAGVSVALLMLLSDPARQVSSFFGTMIGYGIIGVPLFLVITWWLKSASNGR